MRMGIRSGLAGLLLATAACGQGAAEAGSDAPPTTAAASSPTEATVQAGPAVPSVTREFRDWTVTCDNGNACHAFGFAPDFDAGWVRISMAPGPDAQPEIAFGLWSEDFFKGRSTGGPQPAVSLLVDGRSNAAAVAEASDEDAPVGEIRTGARAVITAIAAARSMEILAGETVAISTTGASAALLWIDERQGRLGTTTALIRRGDRPASSVPQPPALPVLRAAPAADQAGFGDDKQTLPASLKALPAVQECLGESEHSEWLLQNVMSARLDARTELWAVPCGAGAYNISHRWYLTGPGGRDPRPADLLGSGGPRTGDEAELWPDNSTINGGYAPNARSIVAFSRGRGIGDCGTTQTWVWTGRRFDLQVERSMGHCAGVPWDYWPTTWRTR